MGQLQEAKVYNHWYSKWQCCGKLLHAIGSVSLYSASKVFFLTFVVSLVAGQNTVWLVKPCRQSELGGQKPSTLVIATSSAIQATQCFCVVTWCCVTVVVHLNKPTLNFTHSLFIFSLFYTVPKFPIPSHIVNI
jgi:hypothetical protein